MFYGNAPVGGQLESAFTLDTASVSLAACFLSLSFPPRVHSLSLSLQLRKQAFSSPIISFPFNRSKRKYKNALRVRIMIIRTSYAPNYDTEL